MSQIDLSFFKVVDKNVKIKYIKQSSTIQSDT